MSEERIVILENVKIKNILTNEGRKMMVDCPHISRAVCIAQLDLEHLKRFGYSKLDVVKQRRARLSRDGLDDSKGNSSIMDYGNWSCVECGTSSCPWLCLSCGLIHCGRNVNQDGLKHFKLYPNHAVCMDCSNYGVFCYICDEIVASDTNDRKVASIRSSLRFFNCSRKDDHSYSTTKYESLPELEDVVEISATRSPTSVYDESTEDEGVIDGTTFSHYTQQTLNDLEIDGDLEQDDASREISGSDKVEFSMPSSSASSSELSEDKLKSTRSPAASGAQFVKELSSKSSGITTGLRSTRKRGQVSVPISELKENVCSTQTSLPSTDASISCSKGMEDVKKLRGLKNLGNTCFMNSVIQALNALEAFRYFMRRLPSLKMETYPSDESSHHAPRYNTRNSLPFMGEKSFLSEELRKTLVEIACDTNPTSLIVNAYGPDALLAEVWRLVPRFRGFQQHDAHEFLHCILDRMHYELKSCHIPDWLLSEICEGGVRLASNSHFMTFKRKKRVAKSEVKCAITAMFEGILQSQLTCSTCRTTSSRQDPFLDLSLDVFVPSNGSRANIVYLSECLRRYFAKEELDTHEQYSCSSCLRKRPATKQLFVRVLPNILCLHLKRFRWSHSHRGKLDNMVDFPLKGLDMKDFVLSEANGQAEDCDEYREKSRSNSCSSCSSLTYTEERNTLYDLFSVVVHHGSGVSSGHYTAYGYHNGRWFHFNDTLVKLCSETTVAKQKAYLLFYVRRTGQ